MLNRRRLLLGGTALATATAIASTPFAASALSRSLAADSKVDAEVIAWLKANALPLATAEPGSGLHDLEPFRAMIGNARIVSMGEATHGTREFFQLKHRLIEYCVSKLGFTIIGFETNYGTALAINDYVLHGRGNAAETLAGMEYWPWDTEEVLALIEWVRAWNVANERKVKFYGFDMQDSVGSVLRLLAYLERVAPDLAAECERAFAPMVRIYASWAFSRLQSEVQQAVFAQVKIVIEAFDVGRDRWIETTTEMEWHLARLSAVVIEQFARSRLADDQRKWFELRDQAMADNIRALLKAEGREAKAILWAHNAHVQRAPFLGLANMGSLLHAAFGPDQVVIGFAFNQGGFQSQSPTDGHLILGDHVVGPAPEGSLDGALAATGVPLLALDLRRVPTAGPVAAWMATKPLQWLLGSMFIPGSSYAENSRPADPRDNYDALIFVDSTNAARRNPTSIARTRAPAPVTSGRNEEPTNLALAASNGIPDGWHMTHEGLYPYTVAVADRSLPRGGRAVRIARTVALLPWGEGALTQSFPATPWRGRRLVFSATMRAEAARIGTGAQLVVWVWRKRQEGTSAYPILALQSDGLVRSPEWMRRSVAVDIPADAERVEISLVAVGNGAHWFGDLALDATDSVQGVTVGAHARQEAIGALPADSVLSRLPWSSDRWR